MSKQIGRRGMLIQCATAAAIVGAPAVHSASKSRSWAKVGNGDHQFEIIHDWAKLPSQYSWQTTHNVAVDSAQNLYVIHEGREELKDHPSIFVFDSQGQFIRAFGQEFQGGGHGLEVRKEGGEEYLYVSAYQQVKSFAKLSLKGDVVWRKRAPMESKVYAEKEDTDPKKAWGRNRFMPTNFAFLDDGGFYLADGYGSFKIHRYNKNGDWQSCFGGAGSGQGSFDTPHGLWIDRRNENKPALVVCDRAHHTLQVFSLDGEYRETVQGFGLPANIDTWRDLMVVPELLARLTLLDTSYKVVTHLGADVERIKSDSKHSIRLNFKKWLDGKFIHPHDACFDAKGDLFVAEWVHSGRVSKLRRI